RSADCPTVFVVLPGPGIFTRKLAQLAILSSAGDYRLRDGDAGFGVLYRSARLRTGAIGNPIFAARIAQRRAGDGAHVAASLSLRAVADFLPHDRTAHD